MAKSGKGKASGAFNKNNSGANMAGHGGKSSSFKGSKPKGKCP